ncbi:MED6-domain-containing protein [Aulographum hederae CBS 113979]|uniref:Mediator of RNA polymerase II transcription subunit 6 n=1 Tax=Aulographum hederae CBS 113979 TaxID=1176131 RepID=A0A6G1HAU7_9PEZI|nr:MED6-domain-containing protein [Aulographum hederae CBS 113979]
MAENGAEIPDSFSPGFMWSMGQAYAYFHTEYNWKWGNGVYHYFNMTPKIDLQSNFSVVLAQSGTNASMMHLQRDRGAFEEHLKSMSGIEYMIIDEPKTVEEEAEGVYVIHKRMRRKVAGEEDQLSVLACYYLIGEGIYRAPSIEQMLSARILNISSLLQRYAEIAAHLAHFSPAHGHSYIPPSNKPTKRLFDGSGTRAGTPTPEPSQSNAAPSFQRSLSQQPAHQTAAADQPDPTSTSLLAESFNLALAYGDEYLDENPLIGEPGAFVFSKSSQQMAAERERERLQEELLEKQELAKQGKSGLNPNATAAENMAMATEEVPLAELKTTDLPPVGRKGSEGKTPVSAGTGAAAKVKEEMRTKRRKSRPGTTPGTPAGEKVSPA